MLEVCSNHGDRSAPHICHRCGVKLCFDCMEVVKGRHVCKPCESILLAEKALEDAARPKPKPSYPTGILPGIVYATLTGIAMALVWEKIAIVLHVQFELHNLVFGFFIGVATLMGTTYSGVVPGLIGFTASTLSVLLGHFWLAREMLTRAFGSDQTLTSEGFFRYLEGLGIIHWLFASLTVAVATLVSYTLMPSSKKTETKPI